jgi:hypothetical protein
MKTMPSVKFAPIVHTFLTLAVLWLIAVRPAQAQTETVLYNFPYQGSEGSQAGGQHIPAEV